MYIGINNILKSDFIQPTGYLSNQLLVATKSLSGSVFANSVILMCAHDSNGAMGVIINNVIENIPYQELFQQIIIDSDKKDNKLPVHYGGPMDMKRGFIIHNYKEFPHPETVLITNNIAISCSSGVLQEIANGRGTQKNILALGYAGWDSGQLEYEMAQNAWISVPATPELVFAQDNTKKWELAAKSSGIDISRMVNYTGHA